MSSGGAQTKVTIISIMSGCADKGNGYDEFDMILRRSESDGISKEESPVLGLSLLKRLQALGLIILDSREKEP